jgi:hypothetical protein
MKMLWIQFLLFAVLVVGCGDAVASPFSEELTSGPNGNDAGPTDGGTGGGAGTADPGTAGTGGDGGDDDDDDDDYDDFDDDD